LTNLGKRYIGIAEGRSELMELLSIMLPNQEYKKTRLILSAFFSGRLENFGVWNYVFINYEIIFC
jgi:hypothetical protein